MKRRVIIAFVVILIAAFAGCKPNLPEPERVKESGKFMTTIEIQDYGNGVYYFPYTGKDFGHSLSNFIGNHPELELVTIAEQDAGSGATGYFVILRRK